MTNRDDPEEQKAELLWRYIEELKKSSDPDNVQFVAITRGECAEVVGVMETAAEAYVLARTESAPHCRREAVRQRLQAAIAGSPEVRSTAPAGQSPVQRRAASLPDWLTAPITARSAGWLVAAVALMAVIWLAIPRPSQQDRIRPADHATAVALMPQLVNGTLDPDRSRAVMAHMLRCKDCLLLYEARLRAAYAVRQSRAWISAPRVTARLAIFQPGLR